MLFNLLFWLTKVFTLFDNFLEIGIAWILYKTPHYNFAAIIYHKGIFIEDFLIDGITL